ncbi:hypothetical protein [Plantibacter sp. H53]|uniref:hypothetical protein n=1 Tax=Plantibacter sp. H53 TaxID=1827323 RepID=UPI0012FAACC3|nr:hypothetical protein [Plantibacter sp. H53]
MSDPRNLHPPLRRRRALIAGGFAGGVPLLLGAIARGARPLDYLASAIFLVGLLATAWWLIGWINKRRRAS